jgi:hypothetical protein
VIIFYRTNLGKKVEIERNAMVIVVLEINKKTKLLLPPFYPAFIQLLSTTPAGFRTLPGGGRAGQ